ncbi:MAG: rod shape-determining protein MreC [Patescibacteria group bacterium]|nr:rod shape-determining protein MreC [Patescibacteria group bacterium]MCL5094185.1 rod shape-determining protein MreC [Patescibacteria group bacterium]
MRSLQNRKGIFKNKNRLFIAGFFLILFLIFLHNSGRLKTTENIIFKIIAPIGRVLNISANSSKGVFSFFSNIRALSKENSELKDKILSLESEVVKLQEFRKENESLRKDLGFKSYSGYEMLPAEIFMYDPSSAKQLILINKGERDGVKKGMTVLSEGILVGKVAEVLSDSATVFLITDPTSGIPAIVANSTASGIVKGQFGYGLSLEKVPQGDILKPGQLVLTSGLGNDYPKGILIGKIEKVDKTENEVFQKATVRPDIVFSRLERVFVVLNTGA